MQAKYPAGAYSGVRARLPDWLIGVPYARYLERAVRLLEIRGGDSVCDIACGPGYNLSRLVRSVGPDGLVTAIEDNPHLLARAQRKVERAGWENVRLLASLDPERIVRVPVDGIIIGYNPPIVLQRHDLLEAAWAILKPGGRLSAVGARCTTPAGRLAGPLIRLGLVVLGHPRDWHCWTVHEPWQHLDELSGGKTSVEPKLGFEYILWAEKDQQGNGSSGQDGRPLS
ncbi:MAG TPA: methyltransferase domain-containing protein [Streptosporangiaceae bacterium]|jgi:SAM-dependent methyltransferase|nr:methyltransferase domain-containing protein [Streptosporangiaceae bacterium]